MGIIGLIRIDKNEIERQAFSQRFEAGQRRTLQHRNAIVHARQAQVLAGDGGMVRVGLQGK